MIIKAKTFQCTNPNSTGETWTISNKAFAKGWTLVKFKLTNNQARTLNLIVTARFGSDSVDYHIRIDSSSARRGEFIKFPGVVTSLTVDGLVQSLTLAPLGKLSTLGVLFLGSLFKNCIKPKGFMALVNRFIKGYQTGGRSGLRLALKEFVLGGSKRVRNEYSIWIDNYDSEDAQELSTLRKNLELFPIRPKFSILLPVFNTPHDYLKRAIESVKSQVYTNWELCVADDFSTLSHIAETLKNYHSDSRIKIASRKTNGHISAASNSALEMATGDYVVLLDHDDELSPKALYYLAEVLNANASLDFIYTDEDKIDSNGNRFEPHFKTDWNPDLFLSYNLITHLACIRRTLVEKVGGFRLDYEGSQDYDLFLRVISQIDSKRIHHIPRILYHWRAIAGSIAAGAQAKNYAHENARKSLRDFLNTKGISAEILQGFESYHRVKYQLPVPPPFVSVIICTRDRVDLLKPLVRDLLQRTEYSDLEILIVNNQSSNLATLDYFETLRSNPKLRVLNYDHPFNYSGMNNWAANQARGEILAFLNNDLRVISQDWLVEMVRFARQPETGAVGAKLYYPNGLIQHAGIILGVGGVAGHPRKNYPMGTGYFMGRLNVIQAYSAVTGACMVIRKKLFEDIGSFDEEQLPIAFSDVDLCLRLREKGFRNLWTPFAELTHLESATRGSDEAPNQIDRFKKENLIMKERWGSTLTQDPYYNPNLTLVDESCGLAFPPRLLEFTPSTNERSVSLPGDFLPGFRESVHLPEFGSEPTAVDRRRPSQPLV